MTWAMTTRAPAKVNLTLHIRGRRADGYHDLESLVAFAGVGDDVRLVAGERLSLTISGPEAHALGSSEDNHILKAVRTLERLRPGLKVGTFHLTKRLPIASGLGGGSSDAAAALRLVAKLNAIALDDPSLRETALATGADVPVCLARQARMMRGIGEQLGIPLALPPLFAVLVNPRVEASTPLVFKTIGLATGETTTGAAHPAITPPLAHGDLLAVLRTGRNDMEAAAILIAPVIADVVAAMQAVPGCRLTRMSGSGATVFGLFDTCRAAATAARRISAAHPDWWVKPTVLR